MNRKHIISSPCVIGCQATCIAVRNHAGLPQECSFLIHPLKILSPKWTPCKEVDSSQYSETCWVCKLIAIEQKSRATPLSSPTKTYLHFVCLCRSRPKEESQLRDRWEHTSFFFLLTHYLCQMNQAMHLSFHHPLIHRFVSVYCEFWCCCGLPRSYTLFFSLCSCYNVVGL